MGSTVKYINRKNPYKSKNCNKTVCYRIGSLFGVLNSTFILLDY